MQKAPNDRTPHRQPEDTPPHPLLLCAGRAWGGGAVGTSALWGRLWLLGAAGGARSPGGTHYCPMSPSLTALCPELLSVWLFKVSGQWSPS